MSVSAAPISARPSAPPEVTISGVGHPAGQQYGEACRHPIREHFERATDRLAARRGLTTGEACRLALPYRDATRGADRDLADEIDGIEAGAGLPKGGAWILQLRAELIFGREPVSECTTFGAAPPATADGRVIAGQNADLPVFYERLFVLLRRVVPGRPRFLTLTPAGQVGHHGMNEDGVAVFANFLRSPGWRVGLPRYLLTRIALERRTRSDAIEAVTTVTRASSRNLLVADPTGVSDVELSTTAHAFVEPEDAIVAHTNHHIASPMLSLERASPAEVANSSVRLGRIRELLREQLGRLDVDRAAAVLRDRATAPHSLSAVEGEWPDGIATVSSTIADVHVRTIWIVLGPPHLGTYEPHTV